MLEETLLSLARQRLLEFRSYIAQPDPDEDQMRLDVTTAFIQVSQLTEIAKIVSSGLSDHAVAELNKIDEKKCKLSRTFGWLYP